MRRAYGALDSKTGIVVLKALQKVNESLGTATVLIAHNMVIGGMADRIINLHDGQISDIKINETKISPDQMEW